MKKKKGFTLIEILATIAVMSIVALIAVPRIVGVIDNVRENAYKESVKSIFRAAQIYIANNEFINFPEEGIDVTDKNLEMHYKDFKSGKIITNEKGQLELIKVSNGIYCAGGTLTNIIVVKGSCDLLDMTPPLIAINYREIRSNLVTIVGIAEDLESGISGYQFSKDNGLNWTEKQTNNEYTFTDLTNNAYYSFKVRAYNNRGLMSESEVLFVRAADIDIPTYTIDTTDWSKTKTVTIHYPERVEGYIYEYSLDNAVSWIAIENPLTAKNILFTENGSIIARILDGVHEVSGSLFTVSNIDLINPGAIITLVGDPLSEDGWAKSNFDLSISALDNESGIDYYQYCSTTDESCTPTEIVNNSTGTVTINTESATNRVCVKSYDRVGNNSEVICSNQYKLDKTLPIIAFNPNGNSTYQKSHSTTVTANDLLSGLKAENLKYLWGISSEPPRVEDFTTSFNNNSILTTPVGSGSYYLGVLAMDKAGNTVIQNSGLFNLDNLKPDVSDLILSVSNVTATSFTINRSGDATDLGGSGLPANPYLYQISLDKNTWVTKCTNNGTSCNASGLTTGLTYYYRVCVVDNAGNEGCTNSNTITPVSGYYCGPLSGTTVAGDVLSGKTFYNSSGLQTGTMPNNGAINNTITTQNGSYTIPAGYHSGSGKVTANFTNLSAGNIKAGVSVGGIAGTFTSDANAVAENILSGKTAYVNGNKITGTMTSRGAVVITPSTSNQTITVGYHNGSGYVKGDSNLKPENIKSGVDIFGVVGTMQEGAKFASGSFSPGTLQTVSPNNLSDVYDYILPIDFTPKRIAAWMGSYAIDGLNKSVYLGVVNQSDGSSNLSRVPVRTSGAGVLVELQVYVSPSNKRITITLEATGYYGHSLTIGNVYWIAVG